MEERKYPSVSFLYPHSVCSHNPEWRQVFGGKNILVIICVGCGGSEEIHL